MWIKICGIRTVENASEVLDCRPDAIGLNFYSKSKRCIDDVVACGIADQCAAVTVVGLFVNHTARQVDETCDAVGVSWIQLHGDEPMSFIAELRQLRPDSTIIRTVRVGEAGLTAIVQELDGAKANERPDYLLVDADVAEGYGGSGRTVPWHVLAGWQDRGLPRLILAGGLSPANVAEAIRVVRPFGVDVASGVENERGMKDPKAVATFIEAARAASS